MAESTAVWGIDIGQAALKALRVGYAEAADQVIAFSFDYIPYPKILSQPDADPEALVRDALEQFLSRNNVKGDRVAVAVPGQTGLARFVKLPPVEARRVPEIVKYEARQQIPFPLEEVIWDFQRLGGAAEVEGFALETEVGLFAMKRDQVERQLAPFIEAGVEVDVVQMAPLALFNYFSYELLDDPSREEGDDSGGWFTVLLDVGTENSNLVITDGTAVWQRNIPLGGSHFTRALSKAMKLTFAKAEHLKCNATKAEDPKAVFQAMRPVFNDFLTEVQRSIGYFSSVHRNSRIAKIVGMGNGFKLPGLQKFIAQNLQLECQRLDEFRVLAGDAAVGSPVFKENIPTFAVAYGLGVQGLGLSTLKTTLLPPEIEQARMIRRKKPWVVATAATFLLGLTISFFGQWMPWNKVHADTWDAESKAAQYVIKDAGNKASKYQAAKGEWDRVNQTGQNLVRNARGRYVWLELYKMISDSLPRDTRTNVDVSERDQIMLASIRMEKMGDVGLWWQTLSEIAMQRAAEQGGASGPGWVITLEGHHFHHEPSNTSRQGVQYVMDTLVTTLRKYKAQLPEPPGTDNLSPKGGVSHVTVAQSPPPIDVDLTTGQPVLGSLGVGRGVIGAAAGNAMPEALIGKRTEFTVQFVFRPAAN